MAPPNSTSVVWRPATASCSMRTRAVLDSSLVLSTRMPYSLVERAGERLAEPRDPRRHGEAHATLRLASATRRSHSGNVALLAEAAAGPGAALLGAGLAAAGAAAGAAALLAAGGAD